jgi:hypothetical protein
MLEDRENNLEPAAEAIDPPANDGGGGARLEAPEGSTAIDPPSNDGSAAIDPPSNDGGGG